MYESYFEKLHDECILRNRSEGTARTYANGINHFLQITGKHPGDLILDDARNFLIDKKKKGIAAATCNQYHSALRFFYKFVLEKPWDGDYIPRMRRDTKQPVILTIAEVERLINTAREPRNKALIALIYSSGLRISEAVNLAPSDIYMSTMQVHVKRSKNHSDRWTILSKRALNLLIDYWHSYSVSRDKLFVSLLAPYKPLQISGVEITIRQIAKEAGIEKRVYPHLLRHSFATHLLEQGVSLEYIQALLGHRSPASTSVYLHLSNKAMMGISNPLDHPTEIGGDINV